MHCPANQTQEGGGNNSPVFTSERLLERWVRGNWPISSLALRRSDRKYSTADRKRTQSCSEACLSSTATGAESQADSRRSRRRDRPAEGQVSPAGHRQDRWAQQDRCYLSRSGEPALSSRPSLPAGSCCRQNFPATPPVAGSRKWPDSERSERAHTLSAAAAVPLSARPPNDATDSWWDAVNRSSVSAWRSSEGQQVTGDALVWVQSGLDWKHFGSGSDWWWSPLAPPESF